MVAAGLRTMIARSLTIIGEGIIGAHRRPENDHKSAVSVRTADRLPNSNPSRSASRPAVATYVAASASQCLKQVAKLGWGDRHHAISR